MMINFRIFTIRFIAHPQEDKSDNIIITKGRPKKKKKGHCLAEMVGKLSNLSL